MGCLIPFVLVGFHPIVLVGVSAFRSTDLEEVVIEEGVWSVTQHAFMDCPKLRKVVLPTTLDESMKECHIKDGTISLGWGCFQGCMDLEKVVLPESLTLSSQACFLSCRELKEINIPSSLKGVGQLAFLGTAVPDLEFPEGCVVEKQDF